jgi:Flp pilus assembly protein TadG
MTTRPPPKSVSGGGLQTSKCLKRIHFLHRKREVRGQSVIEFSLILLPFCLILFAVIDYAQIYYYDNAMQNGLREAARFATAGRIIQSTSTPYETNSGLIVPRAINDSEAREASRNECVRYWFQSNCALHVNITNITITSASSVGSEEPSVITNNGVLHLVSGWSVATNGTTVSTNIVPAISGPGQAGDYVEVLAEYPITTITPLFSMLGGNHQAGSGVFTNVYTVRVSAIVKNEPALLNFEHTNIYSDEPIAPNVQ